MKILILMKSKDSYLRIKSMIDLEEHDVEEFIKDIDEVREKKIFIEYNLLIIDERLWWKDDVLELFDNKIKSEYFQGDFQVMKEKLDDIFPKIEDKITSEEEDIQSVNHNETEDKIRYVVKDKIIEQKVYVDKHVYLETFANIPNKQVLICNLSKRAGSTFLTLNLGRAIADKKIITGVIEPPINRPYIFDTLFSNMEDEEEFISITHYKENKVFKNGKECIKNYINFLIPDPRLERIQNWNYNDMLKLLFNSKANINLIDVGDNMFHPSIEPLLSDVDMILVVIDPFPTECIHSCEYLEDLLKLKEKGYNIEFIINKWSKGLNKKEFLEFVKDTPLAFVPYVDVEYIYKAVVDYKIPYELQEVKEVLERPLDKLIKRIVPEILNDEKEDKTNILKKIFGRKG